MIQAGAAWSGTGLEVINETVVSKEQSGKMEMCRNLANEAEGPAEEPKRTVHFLAFCTGTVFQNKLCSESCLSVSCHLFYCCQNGYSSAGSHQLFLKCFVLTCTSNGSL